MISDGAPGLISAVEQTMPAALRQRCLIHRARNVLAKIPHNAQAAVKADYWSMFEVPDTVEAGLDAVTHVQAKIDAFDRRWRDSYPAAVRILLTDRESLTHYLRIPREHWTRVRHSNFIERTFDALNPEFLPQHAGHHLGDGRRDEENIQGCEEPVGCSILLVQTWDTNTSVYEPLRADRGSGDHSSPGRWGRGISPSPAKGVIGPWACHSGVCPAGGAEPVVMSAFSGRLRR
ncbi:MAG: transposase [Pseudonocardiaceae bacterium]